MWCFGNVQGRSICGCFFKPVAAAPASGDGNFAPESWPGTDLENSLGKGTYRCRLTRVIKRGILLLILLVGVSTAPGRVDAQTSSDSSTATQSTTGSDA